MGVTSLTHSNPPQPLLRTLATLQKHWGLLSSEIQRALRYPRDQATISFDVTGDSAWAGLEGAACERAPRNMGGAIAVLPLADLKRGELAAWIGFQEVWKKGRTNTFAFHHAGLTIHFGRRGSVDKFQIFRAEWSGFIDRNGRGAQFESAGAGHPHWQWDLMQTLSEVGTHGPMDEADELRQKLQGVESVQVFGERIGMSALDHVRAFPLNRFHFASAAPWWIKGAAVANAPSDESGLRRWVVQCLEYIQSELGKI